MYLINETFSVSLHIQSSKINDNVTMMNIKSYKQTNHKKINT